MQFTRLVVRQCESNENEGNDKGKYNDENEDEGNCEDKDEGDDNKWHFMRRGFGKDVY